MPTYLTCLRPYVSKCFMCLRASKYFMPTCLRALIFHVLMCLYIFFVPTCLRVLNYLVPTCAHFSRADIPTTTHNIYGGSLLYLELQFFFELFDLSFHSKTPKQTAASKTEYLILFCRVLLSQLVHAQRQ